MEVKIISREIIKPSSPTPSHLRTFRLSLLDQISPIIYVPIIFFYPISEGHLQKTKLKESLSQTLSLFYPLAGRIQDHLTLDCNDEGVLFSESQVSSELSDFLKQPKLELVDQFLPCSQFCTVPLDAAVQVAVQLNVFACGGIAVGACFFHKIVDGATMGAFLKCWAAIVSGCPDKAGPRPDYSAAAQLFPPRESVTDDVSLLKQHWVIKQGNGVRRRFVFDTAAVSALKDKVRSELVPHPSRVSVVSAFVWKCASRVTLGGPQRRSIVSYSVNMRPRVETPLSDNCFGHMVWQAMALAPVAKHEETPELSDFVSVLKEGIGKINYYTRNVQGEEGFGELGKFRQEMEEIYTKENPDTYVFTSWCKFGFNELDFGWGKPVWVSHLGGVLSPMFVNYVMLIESGSGDGIEVWMCLGEDEMAVLERDSEFLSFASLNPSIVIPGTH